MALKNTNDQFGFVTRTLHWATALLVLVTIPIGLWIANAEFSLAILPFFARHKALGILVLVMIIARVLWHRFSPPPASLSHGIAWQDVLAIWVHRAFYVFLVAMPLSGWIASSATGIDTVIFGRWTLPAIAPVSESWENIGFLIHGLLGKILIVIILLHIFGALFRAFIKRDGTLRRMVNGT